jgi:nucleolar protein 6
MSSVQKLTKKQKKAAAFRQRKTTKGKDVAVDSGDVEDNEIPVMEIQDDLDDEAAPVEAVVDEAKDKKKADKKGKGKAKEDESKPAAASKKRKREEDTTEADAEKPKKKKAVKAENTTKSTPKKDRFILFVGAYSLYFSETAFLTRLQAI